MKRILLFVALLSATTATSQTFSDNFDAYTSTTFIGNTPEWTTWSGQGGGADDMYVSSGIGANSPSNYLYFLGQGAGGPVDIVKDFGAEHNLGQFDLDFMLKVDAGKNAYFNLQRNSTIGQVWALDFNFNADGSFELNNQDDGILLTGNYSQDVYFELNLQVNLSTNVWELFIDGTSQGSFANSNNQIASLNLFPIQNSAYSIDDFSYTVTPYTLQNLNLAMLQIEPNAILAGQNKAPTFTVRNLGVETITSFLVEFSYNGAIITEDITGVNIPSLATYSFDFSSGHTLVSGSNNMTATILSVNGMNGDDDSSDDSKVLTIDPVTPALGKMVVGEEGTGTWCGWCPRGAVNMDIMSNQFDGFWAGIAVHNGDPMTVANYDTGIGALIGGYPSSLVDRGTEIDPSAMQTDFLERIVIDPTATLEAGAAFNPVNRWLEVSMTANFVSPATNGYRMAIVLTEDSVTGDDSGYAQANYYSNSADLIDPAGFNWIDLPSTVPAADMKYDHVARGIFPSFDGVSMFPSTVNPGDAHTLNTYMTVPADWNVDEMHIVGLLIDPQGRIDNAGYASFNDALQNGFVLSTDEVEGELINPVFSMFPNPATNSTTISVTTSKSENVTLSVYDFAGNKIVARDLGVVSGNNSATFSTASLAKGIYAVELTVGNKTEVKKLVVQ